MSSPADAPAPPEHHDEAHDHPTDRSYVMIAIVLAVLTLIEVLTYTFDMQGAALLGVILPIMVVKFVIVGAYFMHLKFDSKMFSTMFIAGLGFAVVVYVVMLTMFEFW